MKGVNETEHLEKKQIEARRFSQRLISSGPKLIEPPKDANFKDTQHRLKRAFLRFLSDFRDKWSRLLVLRM